jgi:hypothetical protein
VGTFEAISMSLKNRWWDALGRGAAEGGRVHGGEVGAGLKHGTWRGALDLGMTAQRR